MSITAKQATANTMRTYANKNTEEERMQRKVDSLSWLDEKMLHHIDKFIEKSISQGRVKTTFVIGCHGIITTAYTTEGDPNT